MEATGSTALSLLRDEKRLQHLRNTRVAVLANPASMTSVSLGFQHTLDALVTKLGKAVSAAFGPQHGMRGNKQYNMEESHTYRDPQCGIPVFSLYGEVRRPTADMLDSFDLLDQSEPGIASITCVRCFTGTVLLEGTNPVRGAGYDDSIGGSRRATVPGRRRALEDESPCTGMV